jgi:hypothetical protein
MKSDAFLYAAYIATGAKVFTAEARDQGVGAFEALVHACPVLRA